MDSEWNHEARKDFAGSVIKAALDNEFIHSDLVPVYQGRLNLLKSDVFNASRNSAKISDWASQALYETLKGVGVNTQTMSYTGVAIQVNAPDASTLLRYQIELDINNATTKFFEETAYTADKISTGFIDINNFRSNISSVGDWIEKKSISLHPDGSVVIDANNFTNNLMEIIDRVNSGLTNLGDATSSDNFKTQAKNLLDSLNKLHNKFASAISEVPGGRLIAFAGTLGDGVELGLALDKAMGQYMANDSAGAINTIATASAGIVISAAGSYAAGMLAAAAAPAGVIVAAALAAGVAAGLLWNGYSDNNSDWLRDLMDIFDPPPRDPIVIDLDGDGIELISLDESKAYFDIDGDGIAERTGWVASDDALLAIDLNENGRIENISELFGSERVSGYTELSFYDENGDGLIDALDKNFNLFVLWRDMNGNGLTEVGELQSIVNSEISSISLNVDGINRIVNGNNIIGTSAVMKKSGELLRASEVLFNFSQVESIFINNNLYDFKIFGIPFLPGIGDIPDLWSVSSIDSNILGKVEYFVEQVRNKNFYKFMNEFDDFIFSWVGVEDVDWIQSIDLISVKYAYDKKEYVSYINSSEVGVLKPKPKVKGYVFDSKDGIELSDISVMNWLEENNYVMHGFNVDLGRLLDDGEVFDAKENDLKIKFFQNYIYLDEEKESIAPKISPKVFETLQKIMGQKLNDEENFIAPDWMLISNPTKNQIESMVNSYESFKKSMMARFIIQVASEYIEGESDCGLLSAFAKNIYYNPFNNKIIGNAEKFVVDFIEKFRSEGLGSDFDALKIISIFSIDNPYLGVYVASNFSEISSVDIEVALNTVIGAVGTEASEEINLVSKGILLAYEGDDLIRGSFDNDIIDGAQGNDTLSGLKGSDTYIYARGDGHDTIIEGTNQGGNDKLVLVDINPDEVTLIRHANNVTLVVEESDLGGGDAGSVLIKNTLADFYGEGIEQIIFADGTIWTPAALRERLLLEASTGGDDTIFGFNIADTIHGGRGNDNLTGAQGSDTYIYARGDGHDTIIEGTNQGGNDKLVLVDINPDEVTLIRHANNVTLVVEESDLGGGDAGSVLIKNTLADFYGEGIEQIIFADGTIWTPAALRERLLLEASTGGDDTIFGFNIADTIHGGLGNDLLNGNGGGGYLFIFAW